MSPEQARFRQRRGIFASAGMTADFRPFDAMFLGTVATRIVNEVAE
jgi:GMP synthase PP-ATPase subunit